MARKNANPDTKLSCGQTLCALRELHKQFTRFQIFRDVMTKTKGRPRWLLWTTFIAYFPFGISGVLATTPVVHGVLLVLAGLCGASFVSLIGQALTTIHPEWHKQFTRPIKEHRQGYGFIRFLRFRDAARAKGLLGSDVSQVIALLKTEQEIAQPKPFLDRRPTVQLIGLLIAILAAGIGPERVGLKIFIGILFAVVTALWLNHIFFTLFRSHEDKARELELFLCWHQQY